MSKTVAITGVAGYVPDFVLTNAMLEEMVDTNDEWILSRTGIKERRILKGEHVGTSVMAAKAVENLLSKTNTKASEIDLVIAATVTPDMRFPSLANMVANACDMHGVPGFDINAACSGFLYALNVGAQMVSSNLYEKVIVIGADKMSSILNYQDRSTCILFGDGAAAVLLESNNEGFGLLDCYMGGDGSGEKYLNLPAGGSRIPLTHELLDLGKHYVFQDGGPVFKMAVNKMAESAKLIMEQNQLSADDVDWLVPHQANKRIIDATAKVVGLPYEKVMMNIEKYGNTTAATIPLCLWEWENKMQKGDDLILVAFGGGYSWGATYLKWAY